MADDTSSTCLQESTPTPSKKQVSSYEFIENILVEKKEMALSHFDKLLKLFIFYQCVQDLAAFGRRYS
jgi:hypothetical protein